MITVLQSLITLIVTITLLAIPLVGVRFLATKS